jgi:hypothetical protein
MYRQRVDDLVNELVTIDNTPISQQTFTTDVLVQFMDDALQATVVPLITSAREEYFVTTYSNLLGPTANSIAIPGESAGFRVRDLYMYNQTGGDTAFNNQLAAKCTRINPDTLPYVGGFGFGYPLSPFGLPSYYIENNSIIFYPSLTQTWIAKLRVFKAPNHLVAYSKCAGQILSKGANNTVTVDNVPQANNGNLPVNTGGLGDWFAFSGVNATTLDVLQPQMPFNFRTSVTTGYVLINKSIFGVAGSSVTLDSDTYNSVQVGDFLVTSQCSPFVQYVPFEAYNLIKLLASMRALKAQGDLANWSVSGQMYNQAAHDFLNLITPKVENAPKKIGAARGGLLGGGLRGRGWW